MSGQLYYSGRFGDLTVMRAFTDPGSYLQYLRNNDYLFDSTLYALLQRFLPPPAQAPAASHRAGDSRQDGPRPPS